MHAYRSPRVFLLLLGTTETNNSIKDGFILLVASEGLAQQSKAALALIARKQGRGCVHCILLLSISQWDAAAHSQSGSPPVNYF